MSGTPMTSTPHPAFGPVDHAWWDVHQRAFAHRVRSAVEQHVPLAFEHVIQLGRAAMKVLACAVDVDPRPARLPRLRRLRG